MVDEFIEAIFTPACHRSERKWGVFGASIEEVFMTHAAEAQEFGTTGDVAGVKGKRGRGRKQWV